MAYPYVGRFAPTPSGRLHFGSLVCALGAFLVARANHGRFLLRIEDLDFQRCKSEYTKAIIEELSILGFYFDDKPYIQSEHLEVYEKAIDSLCKNQEAYYCNCTRAKLRQSPCDCLYHQNLIDKNSPYSVRFNLDGKLEPYFEDVLQGRYYCNASLNLCLKRADGMISYNLACVVDDIQQGVTQVVRGLDLIDITTSQMALYQSFKHDYISYLHLPLVMQDNKLKLSKQNHAPYALSLDTPSGLLISALKILNVDTSNLTKQQKPRVILDKALENFQITKLNNKSVLSPY